MASKKGQAEHFVAGIAIPITFLILLIEMNKIHYLHSKRINIIWQQIYDIKCFSVNFGLPNQNWIFQHYSLSVYFICSF